MKVNRQIEVAVCDFCGNDARRECVICGKDICSNHALTLHVNFKGYGEGYSIYDYDEYIHSTILERDFCPDHITEEFKTKLSDALRLDAKKKKKEKKKRRKSK